MRLPHIRRAAPEVLATAKAQRWDPAEVLKTLLVEEVAGKDYSALATRQACTGFPTGKTFDAWDPTLSSISAPTQQALRTLERVYRWENLVVCGPSGTGKTLLLEALGQHAVEAGLNVAWFTLESLGVLVRRHRDDDTSQKPSAGSSLPQSWPTEADMVARTASVSRQAGLTAPRSGSLRSRYEGGRSWRTTWVEVTYNRARPLRGVHAD
jgi:hypothetical protein